MMKHSSTDADLSEVQSLEFGLGGHVRLEVGCKKNKLRHSSMLCICERVLSTSLGVIAASSRMVTYGDVW